jgi:hypothetical protein
MEDDHYVHPGRTMITETKQPLFTEWKCSCGAVSGIYSDDAKEIEKERKRFEKRHRKCK